MGASAFAAFVTPILGSVAAGGLIGLEREYRGHAAGLRTHILVAVTSTLLMLAAGQQGHWLGDLPPDALKVDPARMAHGVLTGVGFLCGGVIFRQGLSVHGLTTAASLWSVAALGVLFGVGLHGLALAGAGVVLAILVLLRIAAAFMTQHHHLEVAVVFRRGETAPEAEVIALAKSFEQRPEPVGIRLIDGGGVEVSTTFRGPSAGVAAGLAARLGEDPRVLSFSLTPRNI